MSEIISGIITVRTLLQNEEAVIGYVDYTDDQKVQKWVLNKDREYLIPGYQREIRWSPKYVQNLLEDIKFGPKLLGIILVSTSDKKKYEIIDGQQRITVIMMILEKMRRVGTVECSTLDICKLSNETFPFFYEEMDKGFSIDEVSDMQLKEKYLSNDVLGQRGTLYALWKCISIYIDSLSKNERNDLEESLLDCELNIIVSKVNARKRQSRKICVDYFIDINNKSVSLEPIDILKAYAFRERFDEAANDWIEIQKREKKLQESKIIYPKKDLLLHYILCSVNKGLGYKVTKISDAFQLQTDVILDNGKKYIKGTDIEVLITDSDFYREMLKHIILFQEFVDVILRSKTNPDQEFSDYLKPSDRKLDFDSISNIFNILNSVLRSSDIVPKMLIMKYFLEVISNPKATHDEYKVIFPINVLATCFSAGNANLKVRTSYSNIVLKENWIQCVYKKYNSEIKLFPKKIKFGREVQFLGKSTPTSGEYLAKRIAAIAASYRINNKKYEINEKAFKNFNENVKINAEHFFIHQSGIVSVKYKGKEIKCPYPSSIKNRISYLGNYLIIDEDVNSLLGTQTVREKIKTLCQYMINNPDYIVFADELSAQLFEIIKESFKETQCPTQDQIDACLNKEAAKQLVTNYYEYVFPEEFTSYLKAIDDKLLGMSVIK